MELDSITLRPSPPFAPLPVPLAGHASDHARVSLGIVEVDALLGGGLRRDGLHEAYAEAREDAASAMALALLVAWLNYARNGGGHERAIIWARELSSPSLPYGPGLVELGIDPAVLTLLLLPDSRAVLRAALDSVRQGAAGAVLVELRGRHPLLDLTATRRLALAAQASDTMVWLVRDEAQPVPSAAHTRWRVTHAPTAKSPGECLGNRPAFDLTLLRHRGGPEGLHIRMEWDRDTASFQSKFPESANEASTPESEDWRPATSLPGLVPAVATGRTGAARGDRAA